MSGWPTPCRHIDSKRDVRAVGEEKREAEKKRAAAPQPNWIEHYCEWTDTLPTPAASAILTKKG